MPYNSIEECVDACRIGLSFAREALDGGDHYAARIRSGFVRLALSEAFRSFGGVQIETLATVEALQKELTSCIHEAEVFSSLARTYSESLGLSLVPEIEELVNQAKGLRNQKYGSDTD